MRFTAADIEKVTRNAIRSEKENDGLTRFLRFTEGQSALYGRDPMFEMMSLCSAGVVWSFHTTGTFIRFRCRTASLIKTVLPAARKMGLGRIFNMGMEFQKQVRQYGGSTRMDDSFDVFSDGEKLLSLRPKNGTFHIPLRNPEQNSVRIEILFPYHTPVCAGELVSDGDIEPAAPGEKVYCLGDSITQGFSADHSSEGYVSRISRTLGFEALNQGIAGYQYNPSALDGFEKLPKPRLVTVAYGTNDWHMNPSMESIRENVRLYYEKLHRLFADIPVAVITPIWRGDIEQPKPSGSFQDITRVIREEAEKYGNVHLVDGLGISPHKNAYFTDGWLHPNAHGFAYIADHLVPILSRLL